ncbi:MAG: orotidine-5'-phosphate decarboxylase, partial [Nanoarchaeota archaeon]
MDYLEKLRRSADKYGSIACMGLDPVLEAMPDRFSNKGIGGVPHFFSEIFQEMKQKQVFPGVFKPNVGFYLKHDRRRQCKFDGSIALSATLNIIEHLFEGMPIILDFKRGDIDRSSANYAQEGFDAWDVDAVTVHPYMGTDSVMPFVQYCNDEQGRGVYILNRTSNPGAKDFQNWGGVVSVPLYQRVAEKIVEWAGGNPGVGAVVGATSPDELSILVEFYSGKDIPLLIPGVGTQTGSATDVASRLRNADYELSLARINSSSGLTHPWTKKKEKAPEDFVKVCVEELYKLNEEIGFKA